MRIIYYTGKGGTGKSVISAITAIKCANLGHETLLISSDPAHSLRDAFQKYIGNEPTKVIESLWAIHMDPVKEAAEHYGAILDYIAAILKAKGIDEVIAYEIASLPGMTGVATILKIDSFVKQDKYDIIIIDTVPSGEALKYLHVPSIVGKISRRLMRIVSPLLDVGKIVEPVVGIPTPPRELVDKEVEILERMERIRNYLLNHDVTSIRLIANPDSFSIGNIKRTFVQAAIYGLNTDLIILNKVLPDYVIDKYFDEWKKEQKTLINEVKRSFGKIPVKQLRLFDYELRGIDKLEKAAEELFGDEDPAKIYHKGRNIEVIRNNGQLEIVYPAPQVKRGQVEIERIGDELIMHLQTEIGKINLIMPLPTITYKMQLIKAKLKDGAIHVYFQEEK